MQKQVQSIIDAVNTKTVEDTTYGADSVRTITNISLCEFKSKAMTKDLATKLSIIKMPIRAGNMLIIMLLVLKYICYDAKDIYEALLEAETNEDRKRAYEDTLLSIYDIRMNCFGKSADLTMRKAFDWYKYRNDGNEALVYEMFKNTVKAFDEEEGTSKLDISSAFLVPYMYMAIKVNKGAKTIDEEVFDVFDQINDIADYNMQKGNDVGKYKGASDKVFDFMEKYGYLDPTTIGNLATKKYNADPNSLSTQIKVYKMLKAAKLYDHELFFPVAEKVYEQQPSSALATFLAKKASENGNYSKAIKYIQEANESESDANTKAQNLLTIAQFYQAKGDFSSARTYANKAADMRGGWGDPYILIGRLYAASGSKCGPGTGWDSQVVVWAAIDQWNKAKNIDPSVATEAQNLINKYWQYMPSKSDIFLRPDVTEGGSYSIGCWMGVTTTVRSSD
ncbi:MAG: hypothetical protein R2836_06010 [Chitinophagales bacterium]